MQGHSHGGGAGGHAHGPGGMTLNPLQMQQMQQTLQMMQAQQAQKMGMGNPGMGGAPWGGGQASAAGMMPNVGGSSVQEGMDDDVQNGNAPAAADNAPEVATGPTGGKFFSHPEEAVSKGTAFNVMKVLLANPDAVNKKGWHGLSLLHKATTRGDVSIVALLIQLRAEVNAQNEFDETPLMFAAKTGNLTIMMLLIERGADVNAVDKNQRSVMFHACQGGSVAAIHYLSSVCNLSIDLCDNSGVRPLHIIAQHGHLDAYAYIRKKDRSDPTKVDFDGNTAMHYAVQSGSSTIIWGLLLDGGYRMLHIRNKNNETPLMFAEKDPKYSNTSSIKYIKKLEKNKTGYPKGPYLQWYFWLLWPSVFYVFVLLGVQYFLPQNQGFLLLLYMLLSAYQVYIYGHRMHDISKWPSPNMVGVYLGGQVHVAICFFWHIYPALIGYEYTVNFMLVLLVVYICLFIKFMLSDPGVVTRSAQKDANILEGEFTMRELALGLIPKERFCNQCEIIQPDNVKHCKLCRICIDGMDHHCLYFMKCVGKKNHVLFVWVLLLSLLGSTLFVYVTGSHIRDMNSDVHFIKAVYVLFNGDAWLFSAFCLGIMTFAIVAVILLWQFETVSRGETWAFFSMSPVCGLTTGDQFLNVFSFLVGRGIYKKDPFHESTATSMHDMMKGMRPPGGGHGHGHSHGGGQKCNHSH